MLRSWTGGDDRARQAARPSRFQVRPIGREDQALALSALDRNPVRDVFIASRILHDGALTSLGPSPLWGAFSDGELRGLLHVGPNLVPATDDEAACEALATAAGGLYPMGALTDWRLVDKPQQVAAARARVASGVKTRQAKAEIARVLGKR